MEIGNQIKALRTRKGVTQEALAAHLGVTAQAVSKWERNAATPDIELLPQLSAYFGVSMDYLIFGEDCDSFQLRADLLKVISELTEIVRKI